VTNAFQQTQGLVLGSTVEVAQRRFYMASSLRTDRLDESTARGGNGQMDLAAVTALTHPFHEALLYQMIGQAGRGSRGDLQGDRKINEALRPLLLQDGEGTERRQIDVWGESLKRVDRDLKERAIGGHYGFYEPVSISAWLRANYHAQNDATRTMDDRLSAAGPPAETSVRYSPYVHLHVPLCSPERKDFDFLFSRGRY
jgi:hypothetical protein